MMRRSIKYLLAGVVLFMASQSGACQSFYNQGATVAVMPGTIFSVKDSLVNTGILINNGNLVMGGTWLNTGTYKAGTGEITFNSQASGAPQVINHSNQSFSKLTISGGGKKLILADITIEDTMILTDGIIEAENGARVIINGAATVSGGSDAAHIHSPVYHHGAGEKLFPLGNGTVYLPVTLHDVDDPFAMIGIETIELTAALLAKAPSLDAISTNRYWRIDVAEGSLDSRISLPLRNETSLGSSDKWVVVESASLADRFESIGRSASEGTASDGRVMSERAVTLPFVALASTSDDGSILVYNAVSPNGDALNDFLRILNIENYPQNTFILFNRWGDKVFELQNYDNRERVFRGKSNVGGESDLVNGTYFYTLESPGNEMKANGFIVLKH